MSEFHGFQELELACITTHQFDGAGDSVVQQRGDVVVRLNLKCASHHRNRILRVIVGISQAERAGGSGPLGIGA